MLRFWLNFDIRLIRTKYETNTGEMGEWLKPQVC